VKEILREDRGLGTAYERYCLYQLIDRWAEEFGVETMLEGPVDGMAGIAGVHGAVLARRGVKVTAAVPSEEHAEYTRGIYRTVGAAENANVIVAGEEDVTSLDPADMVICYHALGFVADWRDYLPKLAKLARKVLVVAVCNPDNWGVSVMKTLARLKGHKNAGPPDSWYTDVLAPELWKLGRVKEHTYFDAPWWPDLPAFEQADAYAGRSVSDRLRKMVKKKGEEPTESKLADKFVYGVDRWPYFGGAGWRDDLLPALLKHPSMEGAAPKVRQRTAHLHAFVTDMRPRTPRERRRLAQLEADKPAG
jgi:hypothetical protein